MWQALGLAHAGTDELETQQKLTVIALLLLWVNGLPLVWRATRADTVILPYTKERLRWSTTDLNTNLVFMVQKKNYA